jgi:malate permease and related proteins
MNNILLLFLCLIAGIALRRFGRAPDNAPGTLNAVIIHISLPALILLQIHAIHLRPALLLAAAMPWLLFAASCIVFLLVGRLLALTSQTTGALMMMGGLSNTSFIGLPMIESFFGRDEMATGILIDQLGTYLVLSTAGMAVACTFASGTASSREIVKRVVTFPPLIALVCALALLPVAYPASLIAILQRLGDTLAPLALISVGLQLRLGLLSQNRTPLALGLSFKLVLAPLLIGLVYLGIFHLSDRTAQVTVFESAMAPQIGGAIVAAQYGLDADLITLMVGFGTVVAFLTLPVWASVLLAM